MDMRKSIRLSIGLLLFSTGFLTSCQNEAYQSCEGGVWNTLYHITYKGPKELADSVTKELETIGKSLNVFDTTSLVAKLNRQQGILADEHLYAVYEGSRKINKISRGRFDPTLSPLITAWGFGIGHAATADTTANDSILHFVGIDKTHLEGNEIVKEDIRTQFNFSAIAKGYGCDAIGRMFRRNGVEDYLVEIGGEISLSGVSPQGGLWKISIDAPTEDENPEHASAIVIALTDKGIATSGNYRNYRIENGAKLAHTISAVTGRPYISEILSATVIAGNCMEADALATACMASLPDEALLMLEEYGADGMLILPDTLLMTPGFRSLESR